jgi:aminopeptidase N
MAWWDNLWLNEGFASWMETKASDHFHPEWHVALDAQAARDGVMELDARKTTRAIQAPVETEEQAADAFDDIPYVKGQAVVRMLEAWLGEDSFRKGVRAYMATHRFGNTTGANLWAALEKASGKPVARLASDWTTQPGYPLLKVAQACELGRRRIDITQEQYWLDEQPGAARRWQVPVELAAIGGKTSTALLTGPSTTIYQPGCEGTLVIDPAGVGYYRVQYDSVSFAALAAQSPKLGDSTRLRLLSDTWSQAQSGRQPLEAWATLAANYHNESRAAVWSALAAQLHTLDAMAGGTPEQAAVRRFARTLAAPAFARLGWEERAGESVDKRALRPLLATLLIRSGDEAVIEQGRARFERLQQDAASVAPAMRDVVVLAEGVQISEASYATLTARLMQTDSAEERAAVAEALTSAADPALATRTLELALSDKLPAQITSLLVSQVADSGHIALAWEFAVRNREALLRDQEALGRNAFFPSLMSRSVDPAQAEMMERWIGANFGPDALPEALKVGNAVRTRALQKQRLLPQMGAALAGTPPA